MRFRSFPQSRVLHHCLINRRDDVYEDHQTIHNGLTGPPNYINIKGSHLPIDLASLKRNPIKIAKYDPKRNLNYIWFVVKKNIWMTKLKNSWWTKYKHQKTELRKNWGQWKNQGVMGCRTINREKRIGSDLLMIWSHPWALDLTHGKLTGWSIWTEYVNFVQWLIPKR